MERTLEDFSTRFYKEKPGPNCIHWYTTWGLAIIEDEKMWKLFHAAMPYKVEVNDKYYGDKTAYDKMYKWINENITGIWTHSQLLFVFEKEEDSMVFKIRWS